jgi:hypothetical protein
MSMTTAKVERKFLPSEIKFQTTIRTVDAGASRFPKILEMYIPSVYHNEHGTTVHEWSVTDIPMLRKTAKMYYQRYNISSK